MSSSLSRSSSHSHSVSQKSERERKSEIGVEARELHRSASRLIYTSQSMKLMAYLLSATLLGATNLLAQVTTVNPVAPILPKADGPVETLLSLVTKGGYTMYVLVALSIITLMLVIVF